MIANKTILERFEVKFNYSTFKFTDRESGEIFELSFSTFLYNILYSPFFPNSCELLWKLKNVPLLSVEEGIRQTFNYKGFDLATATGDFFFAEKPNLKIESNFTFSVRQSCLTGNFNLFQFKLLDKLVGLCTDQPDSFINLCKYLLIQDDKAFIQGKFSFDSTSKQLRPIEDTTPRSLFINEDIVELKIELTDCSVRSADTVFVVVSPQLETQILSMTEAQRYEREQFKDKLELTYRQSCISNNNDLPVAVSSLDCYDKETVSLLSVPPTIHRHLELEYAS